MLQIVSPLFLHPEGSLLQRSLSLSSLLRLARHRLLRDPTVRASLRDLEVPSVAPRGGPRVLHSPVRDATLRAIANDLNRVATELRAGFVDVDPRLVGWKMRTRERERFGSEYGSKSEPRALAIAVSPRSDVPGKSA